MLAEHADVAALDGVGVSVDGGQHISDVLCHSSNVTVCLLPVDSLQVQVQGGGGCHVWQGALQPCDSCVLHIHRIGLCRLQAFLQLCQSQHIDPDSCADQLLWRLVSAIMIQHN